MARPPCCCSTTCSASSTQRGALRSPASYKPVKPFLLRLTLTWQKGSWLVAGLYLSATRLIRLFYSGLQAQECRSISLRRIGRVLAYLKLALRD